MDLTTTYLGYRLRSPLVASAGPLTGRVDTLRALVDAGIGAVVLPSLFEEQVVHDELATTDLLDLGHDAHPEATGYFPQLHGLESVADRQLRLVEEAKAAIDVPVIASLNGVTTGGWTRYAQLFEDAGADGLELNVYRVAADVHVPGSQVEDDEVALVEAVRASTSLPLAVKISSSYSSVGHMCRRLSEAGADALVLFNRFYQPELAVDTRRVEPKLELSSSSELRVPVRWIGLLHGRVDAQLAATTGVHTGEDAARALLAGATVVMMTSALLRHGPSHVAQVESELVAWAEEHGYASVAQVRGSASHRNVRDPDAFERANYVDTLTHWVDRISVGR